MVSVAAFFLMLLAFAAIGHPLLRATGGRPDYSIAEAEAPDALEEERDAAYRAVRELEAEYQIGHLSREDYEALREEGVERAAQALWRLDTARAASPRRTQARGTSACPACGARRRPGDHFCGACGRPLGVRP